MSEFFPNQRGIQRQQNQPEDEIRGYQLTNIKKISKRMCFSTSNLLLECHQALDSFIYCGTHVGHSSGPMSCVGYIKRWSQHYCTYTTIVFPDPKGTGNKRGGLCIIMAHGRWSQLCSTITVVNATVSMEFLVLHMWPSSNRMAFRLHSSLCDKSFLWH